MPESHEQFIIHKQKWYHWFAWLVLIAIGALLPFFMTYQASGESFCRSYGIAYFSVVFALLCSRFYFRSLQIAEILADSRGISMRYRNGGVKRLLWADLQYVSKAYNEMVFAPFEIVPCFLSSKTTMRRLDMLTEGLISRKVQRSRTCFGLRLTDSRATIEFNNDEIIVHLSPWDSWVPLVGLVAMGAAVFTVSFLMFLEGAPYWVVGMSALIWLMIQWRLNPKFNLGITQLRINQSGIYRVRSSGKEDFYDWSTLHKVDLFGKLLYFSPKKWILLPTMNSRIEEQLDEFSGGLYSQKRRAGGLSAD